MAELFTDLPAAFRLSTESIYRLPTLNNPQSKAFQEETLTELLVGFLTGSHYRIQAPCPTCRQDDCSHWDSTFSQEVEGSHVGLLTKKQEKSVGADFIYRIVDSKSKKQVVLLIQAKKIQRNKDGRFKKINWPTIENRARDQYDTLVGQKGLNFAAYYLFYPELEHAHDDTVTLDRCGTTSHNSVEATSAVLVAASQVKESIRQREDPVDLLRRGRSFICLTDGIPGGRTSSDFDKALHFVQGDYPKFSPCSASIVPENKTSIITHDNSVEHKATRTSKSGDESNKSRSKSKMFSIALIILGDWNDEDSDKRSGYGYREKKDSQGEDLKNSTRMYWRMNHKKAENLDYLVACRRGTPITAYRITDIYFHHDKGGKVEFGVETMPEADDTSSAIIRKSNDYLKNNQRYGGGFRYLDVKI